MSTLIAKVWYDLWQDKSRTIQVVLVIALGAIGIGLVIGGRNLIANTINEQWTLANPANIKVSVSPPLNDQQLGDLERIDGVAEIEGLLSSSVEFRVLGETEWQNGLLNSRDDYADQKMEVEKLISGQWPGRNDVSVVRTADELYGVNEGDVLEIRYDDKVRQYPVTGVMKPVGPFPVVFVGALPMYVTRDTFSQITGRDTYNLVQTRDIAWDPARAEAADLTMQDYFERNDIDSAGLGFPFQRRIVPPNVPPAAELLNALFLILGVIGVIIIILGIFLVYNSVSAIVSQQVSQIGVMKAIGASSWQVLSSYLALVLAYGLLAVAVSVPVGGLAARGLENIFINLLNLDPTPFIIDPLAVTVQVAICLIAPLIAALVPLRTGMTITVREAISTYGLAGAAGLVERLVARAQRIPYSILLVISNTFRNQRRSLLIGVTLVVAGVIFMMVMGVNDATAYTFDGKLASIHNYQVTLSFEQLQREAKAEEIAASVPGVTASEGWLVVGGKARPVSQAESEVTDARVSLFGQPANTDLYRPEVLEGRWLTPADEYSAVVHSQLAAEKGWSVGDTVTFEDANGRESDWEIVGTHFDPAISSSIHVPLASIQREQGAVNRVNTFWAQTADISPAGQTAVAEALIAAFEGRGVKISSGSTFGENTIAAITSQRRRRLQPHHHPAGDHGCDYRPGRWRRSQRCYRSECAGTAP